MNINIIFLQDTHLTENKVQYFDALWKGKCYHSCFTNNRRGTSILIHKNTQHTLLFQFTCERGNYVIIGCKIGADTYVLGCIYGPNKDEPDFYAHLDNLLGSVECDHIILGGDFNFVMNWKKDSFGYVRENNINARSKFIAVCDQHNLIDIWRQYNANDNQYTWLRTNPSKGARLDMFFVSEHLSALCVKQKITPGYRTDHNMISIEMKIPASSHGPGLWKFNESLLKDDKYIEIVKECINKTIEQYALPVYSACFLTEVSNYKDISFQIEDDLFYETLLMMIRGESVKFAKQRAKQQRKKENELLSQIEKAQSEHFATKTDQSASRLKQYKEQLEKLREPQIAGLIIRSRTQWHEEGERSSKYFLGLEKRNALRKSVGVIKVGEQILTRTNSILKAFSHSLSGKYNKQHDMPPNVDEYIKRNVRSVLSTQEKEALDSAITYEELTEAMQRMKKGKSPGANGYTAAFFRYFWNELGPFLYRAHQLSTLKKEMMLSHREGIITLIPKAGQSPDQIKAWRPITLLNVDFKIISSAISARLQQVISKLTDACQTAYVKGRFIGENTRLVYDVINSLSENEQSGLIVSADFESAFDSLSWDFVERVFTCCNFGTDFIQTLKTSYLNEANFSRIMLNGHLGDKIFLKCGIRQGDPASGYIFNMAVNVLASQIKQSHILTGIRISNTDEVRISQYADDTVLFLKDDVRSIQGALTELETFSKNSGLYLNVQKTACMSIGARTSQNTENVRCKVVQEMKILGITFSNNIKGITEANLEPKINQITKEIAQWRRRNITPLGRITVIKSLLLSKLIHILTVLPHPAQNILKKLEQIFFSFVWQGRRDPVKRAKIVQSYETGGLQMVDVDAFIRSLKLTWLKRLTESTAAWAMIAKTELPYIHDILQFGSKMLQKIRLKIKNPFWQDVVEAYSRFSIDYKPDSQDILSESLWFSDYSKYKCSIVKDWDKKGVRFIADLFDENTRRIMTKEMLKEKFGIRMTVLCYASLIRSIPEDVKSQKGNIPKPIIPTRMNMVLNQYKFSRFAYDAAVKCRLKEIIKSNERQEHKWVRDIGHYEANSFVTVINATHSQHLVMFHYKIINRFLTTNKFLQMINIKDDDACTFCNRETETLAHMFWFCEHVQTFINSVEVFLKTKYNFALRKDIKVWFFLHELDAFDALIITLIKRVIYEARLDNLIPNVTHFRNKLRREAEIERTAGKTANRTELFTAKWGMVSQVLGSGNESE